MKPFLISGKVQWLGFLFTSFIHVFVFSNENGFNWPKHLPFHTLIGPTNLVRPRLSLTPYFLSLRRPLGDAKIQPVG